MIHVHVFSLPFFNKASRLRISKDDPKSYVDYLTIRLRVRVFYEQIVNEAQPS